MDLQSEEAISNSEDYEVINTESKIEQKAKSEQHLTEIEKALKEERDKAVL